MPEDEHRGATACLKLRHDSAIAKHRIPRSNGWSRCAFRTRQAAAEHQQCRRTPDRRLRRKSPDSRSSVASSYWALPTTNYGYLGKVESTGRSTQSKLHSGTCYPGYHFYWNGYIPANRVDNTQGKPDGVMGVPKEYQPAHKPIIPMPADGGTPGDPMAPYYDSNTVWVKLANGRNSASLRQQPASSQNQYAPGPLSSTSTYCENTHINERFNLRFNADFFNVLNMPGLPAPNTSTGIISLQNSARNARQLSLRLTW